LLFATRLLIDVVVAAVVEDVNGDGSNCDIPGVGTSTSMPFGDDCSGARMLLLEIGMSGGGSGSLVT